MAPERWEDDFDRRISDAEVQAAGGYGRRASNEVERVLSASSVSTASSHASARGHTHGAMSHVPTHRDLERNPTVLDRIQTARSQHSATVGSTHLGKSNTRTRDSKRPLPPMGAGKAMPPLLDSDQYVVDFDGPDDPIHAQNWPLQKK